MRTAKIQISLRIRNSLVWVLVFPSDEMLDKVSKQPMGYLLVSLYIT